MSSTSIRLPDDLEQDLDALAAERHTTRSELIREAIEHYCREARAGRSRDRVDLLRQLVDYEGSGEGNLAEKGERYLRDLFHARRARPR